MLANNACTESMVLCNPAGVSEQSRPLIASYAHVLVRGTQPAKRPPQGMERSTNTAQGRSECCVSALYVPAANE